MPFRQILLCKIYLTGLLKYIRFAHYFNNNFSTFLYRRFFWRSVIICFYEFFYFCFVNCIQLKQISPRCQCDWDIEILARQHYFLSGRALECIFYSAYIIFWQVVFVPHNSRAMFHAVQNEFIGNWFSLNPRSCHTRPMWTGSRRV